MHFVLKIHEASFVRKQQAVTLATRRPYPAVQQTLPSAPPLPIFHSMRILLSHQPQGRARKISGADFQSILCPGSGGGGGGGGAGSGDAEYASNEELLVSD